MVEITNARFAELIDIEARFNLIKAVMPKMPSYVRDDVLNALIADESEVKQDAE